MKRLSLPALFLASLYAACSGEKSDGRFPDASTNGDAFTFTPDTGPGLGDAPSECVGLECRRPNCGGSNTTTLTGTVYAPNGADPLYNALVFIPNGELQPFTDDVTCETCATSLGATAVSAALTDTSGHFELKDMPAGDDIPLVVQVGRFRRKIILPKVNDCKENTVAKGDARLPKNTTEGDIPRIAIVTSTYDPTECILQQIGIDSSEFSGKTGTGRIHLYTGNGATISGAMPGASLWDTVENLKHYQLIALPCSSYPTDDHGKDTIFQYASAGGRVFATDLSYPVVSANHIEWMKTGDFTSPGSFVSPAQIDQTFPKGQALAEWLQKLGAATNGTIPLTDTYSRVGKINAPAQRWLYSGTNTQSYTFNTPTDAEEKNQCGRVFYSSFHIGSGRGGFGTFPSSCTSKPLTPQERVLEFMLFDLASCVQSDSTTPVVPR